MTSEQIDALVEAVAEQIGCWSDMEHLKIRYCDDGDGYRDFMGMSVTREGRESLRKAISEWLARSTTASCPTVGAR
jgi:hypothetical protein